MKDFINQFFEKHPKYNQKEKRIIINTFNKIQLDMNKNNIDINDLYLSQVKQLVVEQSKFFTNKEINAITTMLIEYVY